MDAKAGEKAANAALDMARGALAVGLPQMEKQKELAPFVSFMEKVQAGLRAASVQRQIRGGASVGDRKSRSKEGGAGVCGRGSENARKTAHAHEEYEQPQADGPGDAQLPGRLRALPADAIYDKNGKPLLSWRVMVLPYIEQDALYKQFHLDEPWDSDHNKKLLEKMPPLFAAGDEQALKNHETHYQGFVGKRRRFGRQEGH